MQTAERLAVKQGMNTPRRIGQLVMIAACAYALMLDVLSTSPPLASPSEGFESFDDFLARYRAANEQSRGQLTESFIEWQQEQGGFPVVELEGDVVFFYLGHGGEHRVSVVGDFSTRSFYNVYWDDAGILMSRAVSDGTVFFKRLKFEKDARVDYKFVVDGEYRLDPLNPRTTESGTAPPTSDDIIGKASELVMPGFQPYTEMIPRGDVAKGTLRVLDEAWADRTVTVYLPAEYDDSKRYPVVYTADGSAWINLIRLPTILDNLIASEVIEPVIAVMIDPTDDRSAWYYFNQAYLAYLEKVIEHVDTHFSTKPRAEERLHIGTSSGGRITLYVGLERPRLFGNIGMLSPSLSGSPHYYAPYFSGKTRPPRNLRIWLSAGTYEGYIYRDTQTMERYFKSVGLETRAAYTHEGHSFGAWRHIAGGMLEYFFPADGE